MTAAGNLHPKQFKIYRKPRIRYQTHRKPTASARRQANMVSSPGESHTSVQAGQAALNATSRVAEKGGYPAWQPRSKESTSPFSKEQNRESNTQAFLAGQMSEKDYLRKEGGKGSFTITMR